MVREIHRFGIINENKKAFNLKTSRTEFKATQMTNMATHKHQITCAKA